jgi:adenine-specific DNA-methyltransferase
VDFDNTENLYIEGDNLEVLKLLQESYLGKIKMIYIDPPYNTGKDFVYKDNFRKDAQEELIESGQKDQYNQRLVVNAETAGRYHSDWLSMMYPRLKLARNLLQNDGLLFISIDDNELDNLKKLCDSIFGEQSYMGLIARETGTPTGGGNDAIVNKVDYILVYSKSGNNNIQGLPMTAEESKIYDKEDDVGRYLIRSLRRTGGEDRREDRPSMYFPITAPDGTPVYPIGPTGYESRWICGKDTVEKMVQDNLIEWKENNGEWTVYQKFYLEGRLKQPSNLWSNVEGNKKATRDLKKLFEDKKVFDFPKPVGLIETMIQLVHYEDGDIILDFFSGSGTTAHAVMKLNSIDNKKRRFISVQIPELLSTDSAAYKLGYKDLSQLGAERIRRAAKSIKVETSANIDYGFRFYRLDTSNMQDVYYKPQDYNQGNLDLFADNVKPDRTADDLLAQVMLDWGLPLSLKIEKVDVSGKKVYKVAENSLYACFDSGIDEDFAKDIAKDEPLRIVFKDSGFKNDTAKTNVMQLLKQLSPETEMKVI